MSKPSPQIVRTPGAPAPPQSSADPGDDLAGLEDGGTLPAVDPVQAQLAELQAEVKRLKRRGQADPAKPKTQEPEMSEAEAQKYLAEQIASGVRPRSVLTPSGWMTHREQARGPGSMGNTKPAEG